MREQPNSFAPIQRIPSIVPLLASLVAVVGFFVISSTISYRNIKTLQQASGRVSHTYGVIEALENLLSLMRAAETGQRGFLITGDEKYLEPYNASLVRVESCLDEIKRMISDDEGQQQRLVVLRNQIGMRLQQLAEVIVVRREKGFEQAQAIILTDRGKAAMDAFREQITLMQDDERKLLEQRFLDSDVAFGTVVRSGVVSGVLAILLAIAAAVLSRRSTVSRQTQQWLQSGQNFLSEKLVGDQNLNNLGGNALRFLCEYLEAQAGAIYMEEKGSFRRVATYAVPSEEGLPSRFSPGEGLLGQAVKDRRAFLVHEVPEGYLTIGSALGTAQPRHLLVAPVLADGEVNAVIEFGFFHEVPAASLELLTRSAEMVGGAVRSANSRARIEELLEETQRQAAEMQAQSEELRVSNEELEEQSRALQKTQAQLEQQQAELEQTNVQLEEQTQLLEAQKSGLIRAKLELEAQARVVEQASRYKSDFLANMSHELRTPLNSSLILAQLLAENRPGNLTEEQIKYARTIQASGNDLLALINDVLDLAKIEAGKMDLQSKPLSISQLLETMRGQFEPVANKRGLMLELIAAADAPEEIETDPMRVEQILRNLLSNALKFTEAGKVALEISSSGADQISFAVRDTGIGIDAAQQRIIFEPFCQADGTTNRKYGGTGLGLSISREIARLLGGEIQLTSEPGKGSVFTVVIPTKLQTAPQTSASALAPVESVANANTAPIQRSHTSPSAASSAPSSLGVKDDREGIDGRSARVILVVEDDANFSSLLVELAHELEFKCLVTASANEALALAREYLPCGVLLDVGLPDGSGLFVLDRLKHDARTRHIPVHVVSGSDYAEKALAMGAIGYLMKPVARERISEALQALESQLTHRLRKVLVVEDDPVQLGALCDLLGSREVEAVGVQDVENCLERLRSDTFDCMVLDLSLPGASGFSLLERISADDNYPFPPVIIYTGRELSVDEEQQLRRYSKSIIIKGAKSPERLLDEVALFLHQVVTELPVEQQRMIEQARSREAALEGRRVLLVEDDVRNIFALTSLLEPLGLSLSIARNGREALEALQESRKGKGPGYDLVLMDIMMPEMDGLTAMREIRKVPEWQKLPIIALTAKAMASDQQECLAAGANDYLAKPLDVEKLLSLVRVWMPR